MGRYLTSLILVLAVVVCCKMSAAQDKGQAKETAAGEATLKSWGNFAAGTWTSTVDGEEKEHTYEWMEGKRFLKLTAKEKSRPAIGVVGVDPNTGKCTFWIFVEDGTVGTMTLSQTKEADGFWKAERVLVGPKGKVTSTGIATPKGDNKLEVVFEDVVDGVKQPPRKSTWTRK